MSKKWSDYKPDELPNLPDLKVLDKPPVSLTFNEEKLKQDLAKIEPEKGD